jgi:hypothetical protein
VNYREDAEDGTVILEPEWMDSAIIGYAYVNDVQVLVYSYYALVSTIMKNDGSDFEGAQEWIEYNTIPSLQSMGVKAPIIVYVNS